jgi:hypothetical protein
MSLLKFGYTVDMDALESPLSTESFFLGYDLDGILKQKDSLGNITPIGTVTSVIGAESNFSLSSSGLDSLGNKTASIIRTGNLRIGTTHSYTQMSGSTFSIYTNNGITSSLYFSVDGNNLVINNSNTISGDKFHWGPSTGLQFNNNVDSNLYSVFSSKGLSFSSFGSVIDITAENISITNNDYTLSLDINQGISYSSLTGLSFISATSTGFRESSNSLTLLPTTLSGDQVQYYQNKSGTFSLLDDVINSSLFYLVGSTNSAIDSKTQSIYRTGNIGIGTASPSTKLHIFATQSGALRLQDGTQANNYILKSDSNGVATWVPLSNVGISGTVSYIPKFTGTSSLGNSNFIDNGSSGSYIGANSDSVTFIPGANVFLRLFRTQSSMSFILGNPSGQVGQIQSQNTLGLDIKSQGYLAFSSGPSYSEAMRISSNGYVGIGLTAIPSSRLHVFATQSGFGFRLQDGSQDNNYILTSNSIGMGSWTSSISVSKFQLTGGQPGYILISDASGVGSWTFSSAVSPYWIATGSNIINSNPTGSVIINHPTGGLNGIAFRTATFTSIADQNGFGVYNSGNVGGNWFYGSWFNVPSGNGIQDFTAFTKFYINSSAPYNWISNQPMVIGSTTSIPSIGTNRFIVSSFDGTASFVVNENGSVIINSATAMSGTKLFIQSNTASVTIGSNVMLDLYNGQQNPSGSQVSELAFSADAAGIDTYNTQHRYAVISGYATTWNNTTTGGGIKFSTRETTGSTLTEKMTISPVGNVGLGTASPSTKLHVYATQSGALRLEDGTQGAGYILTSDTNGVASWTASFALGVIATSSNITTDTLDINGLSQRGRCIIIDNGTYSINLTVNGATGFSSTYLKHGTASVTFVQGSGRTLVQVDGTVVLNGVAGSTATLLSYGTTDYLRINNA